MSMPLLYNIEKFNNIVKIQCSVSMYTGNLQYRLAQYILPSMGETKVT